MGQGVSFGIWGSIWGSICCFWHGEGQLARFAFVFFGQQFCKLDGSLIVLLRVIVLQGIAHERQQHAALCGSKGHVLSLLRMERKGLLVRQGHLNIGGRCGLSMITLGQIGQQRTLCERIIAKKVGQIVGLVRRFGGGRVKGEFHRLLRRGFLCSRCRFFAKASNR